MKGDLPLALRLLRRDWQAGELRVLMLALLIAVSSTTLIQFFSDRLQRGMVSKAGELLGGDLVIASPQPLPQAWLDRAMQPDTATASRLETLRSVEFSSVAIHGDAMQLASVKAVETHYPLRGQVRTAAEPFVAGESVTQGPAPGSVWVEARILSALGIRIGDTLDIGDAPLQVSRVLTYETDRGGSFYSFSPRIIMALADVDATHVIQPGSRMTYRLALAGDSQRVDAFRVWVIPQLSSHHKLQDIRYNRPELSSALTKAESYLGLSSLMAVLLAGVAIAMAASRYSARHFDMSAMLRCLGMSQGRIVRVYAQQFLVIGVVGSMLGCALGWTGQFVLEILLRTSLPVSLPPPGWTPVFTGLGTGFITLAGFALPPVLRLKDVPPLRVLRRDVLPPTPAASGVYALAIAALALLMWQHTGNLTLTLTVLVGTLVAMAVFALLALLCLHALQGLRHVGLAWRLAIRRLGRTRNASVSQLLAFSLTLMAMTLLVLVRTDLLTHWQAQLPTDAPNHFAINILPADKQAFTAFLDQRAVSRAHVYPMVRGRLTHLNDQPILKNADSDTRKSDDLNRELNLTWTTTMETDNRVVAGEWWDSAVVEKVPAPVGTAMPGSVENPSAVSLERRFAERLHIQVGDRLRFSIAGLPVYARVASLRHVQWDSFKPNFYVIFAPGALDAMPATYMTSFHLRPEQKIEINALVKRFPSASVLEVDAMLTQVKNVLVQVTLAVEYILIFALAAGVVVLWAAVQTTLSERLQEGALLRALGAERTLLKRAQRIEFFALGGLAGLLAACGAELTLWLLYRQIFQLEFSLNPWVWAAVPALGILLVGSAGVLGTRKILEQPPQTVLRET